MDSLSTKSVVTLWELQIARGRRFAMPALVGRIPHTWSTAAGRLASQETGIMAEYNKAERTYGG